MPHISRPQADEHNPYFSRYIDRVPENADALELLENQIGEMEALLGGIDEADAGFRYAPGKWSYKEMIGHMLDTERIFITRALCAARGDQSPLPGFEQDDYVERADFDRCTLADLLAERRALRQSNLFFFRGLSPEAWTRKGSVDGSPCTARAILFTLAGHDMHHLTILRERYLSSTLD